jgi:CNT family concentrative nucleoside transporter
VSSGTLMSMKLVVACVANLVSFMAITALANGVIAYLGALVGLEWSLELLLSYLFLPVALMLGIRPVSEAMVSFFVYFYLKNKKNANQKKIYY